MKEENKIPISAIKAGIERYKHIALTDREWNVGLYGWRRKYKYHSQKTLKGWINEVEAQTLINYLTSPYTHFVVEEGMVVVF